VLVLVVLGGVEELPGVEVVLFDELSALEASPLVPVPVLVVVLFPLELSLVEPLAVSPSPLPEEGVLD